MFFAKAGLFIPKRPYQRSDGDGTQLDPSIAVNGLDNVNCNIFLDSVMSLCLDDIIKRYNDKNIKRLQVCSIICFFLSVLLIFYIEEVFEVIGAGPGKGTDYKVTTLGISATIMTLYNMIAWPHIHEKSEKIRIHNVKTEMGRAKELYNNLDLIVDFISSIMGQIKELASGNMDG